MTLQCERSRRKFKLENNRLEYIEQLFSHIPEFDSYLKFKNEEYLESEESGEISDKINEILDTNSIFEYRSEDNELVPVVNPSNKTMFNNQMLFPVSQSTINFLSKFSEFLDSRQRIDIIN